MTKEDVMQIVMMKLEGHTYQEIGDKYGFTRSYAEQLVKTALEMRGESGVKIRQPWNIKYPQIAERLTALEMSVYALAKAIGENRPDRLYRVLKGKNKFLDVFYAKKIADAVGLTIDEAFFGETTGQETDVEMEG